MKKLICECCGAPLNPVTLICEYCGTPHKRDKSAPEQVLRIETFQQPVVTLGANCVIDDIIAQYDPQTASKLAMENISRRIAESITPYISFKSYMDGGSYGNVAVVKGTIKVVKPISNFARDERGTFFGEK